MRDLGEPKTSDYCTRCGCSPESGNHWVGLCEYSDPRTTLPERLLRMATREPRWTLDRALELVRMLEPHAIAAGYHVALGGSVLHAGSSDHDVDVICYPRCLGKGTPRRLAAALEHAGLIRVRTASEVLAGWKESGSADRKRVEIWYLGSRRVDIIMPADRMPERKISRGR